MINAECERDIQLHALKEFPNEMCGIISDGKFIPAENLHPAPKNHFRMDPRYLDDAQAIVHSHTFEGNTLVDMRTPSVNDLQQQQATNIPWFIVGVKFNRVSPPLNITPDLNEPLEGRDFIHCVKDCWQLARAYYWQEHGLVMSDVVRSYDWWENGYADGHPMSLIDKHYADFGFYKVDTPQEGDIVILKVLSKVNNHCGIYKEGQLLHHMVNRFSGLDQYYGRWKKYTTMYLRHKDIK